LNISREGDSTASLGSLFQCSVTLRGKKFFLMFRRNFLCFSLSPLPLVLSLGITGKSLVFPHPAFLLQGSRRLLWQHRGAGTEEEPQREALGDVQMQVFRLMRVHGCAAAELTAPVGEALRPD